MLAVVDFLFSRGVLLVGDAGEETTLSQTKSASHGEKSLVVLDHTQANGHDTPDNHDAGNPDAGTPALHGHVGGNLSSDIEGEEDGHGNLTIERKYQYFH
jgi:hypothetical protein